MPFFANRNRDRGDERFLLAKVRIFSIGAMLALGGMFLDEDWLIWGALGVLGCGLILRVIESFGANAARRGEAENDSDPGGDPEGSGPEFR